MLIYAARYVEIVPGERILTTSTMHTGDRLSNLSVTSVEFWPEGRGTRLVVTEHGIYLPGQEQPAWREEGTAQMRWPPSSRNPQTKRFDTSNSLWSLGESNS